VSGRQLQVTPRPTQFRGRMQQHADLERMARLARGVPAPALTESLERCALDLTRAARIPTVSPFDPGTGTIEISFAPEFQL
jgi:hypothetical protein